MTDEKFNEIMQWVSEQSGQSVEELASLFRMLPREERAVFAKQVAIKFEVDEAEFAEEFHFFLMKSVRPWLKKSDVKKETNYEKQKREGKL